VTTAPTGLDHQLGELGAEALLIVASNSRDPDLARWVGPVHLGLSLLVAPRGSEPRLGFFTPMERGEAASTGLALLDPEALEVPRWTEEGLEPPVLLGTVAARALALVGVAPGRIALAGHGPAGVVQGACALLAKAGWTLVPGNGLSLMLRKRKTPRELAALRQAAEGTCRAMREVATLLARAEPREGRLVLAGEPLTVARLRAAAGAVLAAHGLEQPEGNIIAPGEEGAVPHTAGTPDRVLRPGESLVVDLFPKGSLFADLSRTFCIGPPPEPLARAHAAVRDALARAHAAVRDALERAHRAAAPGIRGTDIHEQVCHRLEAAGYLTTLSQPQTTTGYVHGLGHGVGYQLHEYPSFKKRTGAEGVLGEGDVFTLEPGLYDPDAGWGVRLEDLVHLGPEGPEILTPLPYDLDPRAWI
jgi:Xaa-Pro aminopeptidase